MGCKNQQKPRLYSEPMPQGSGKLPMVKKYCPLVPHFALQLSVPKALCPWFYNPVTTGLTELNVAGQSPGCSAVLLILGCSILDTFCLRIVSKSRKN
jgi:hypothetical protein